MVLEYVKRKRRKNKSEKGKVQRHTDIDKKEDEKDGYLSSNSNHKNTCYRF